MKHHEGEGCPQTAYPECVGQLARIEEKLDTLCASSRDQSTRLRDLEDDRSERKGAWKLTLAIGGTIGAAIGATVSAIISWLLSTHKTP